MKKLFFTAFICIAALNVFAQFSAGDDLASQYYRNGEWEKALSLYQELFNRGNQQYYDQYLNTLLKLKKYDEAGTLVKKMAGNNDASFTYKVDYGRILQEQGEQEKADQWYNELVKKLPANEFAIRDLAVAFYRAGAYDYSVKALLNGRKLLKNESAFTFDLLSLYRYQKNKNMLVQEYVSMLDREPSPELLNQAKNSFAYTFESPEDFAVLKVPLLHKLQKSPQNAALSDLLVWVYIQQKEYNLAMKQAIALENRLKEEGDRVYDLTLLLISNKAYPAAVEGLEYLIKKGSGNPYYIPAKIQLLRSKYQMLTDEKTSVNDLNRLANDYQALLNEFGKNKNTVFAMQQLANLKAFYLDKPDEAETLLEETLRIPQLPPSLKGQIKLELGDVYILTGEVWEAALIYGQAEKEFAGEPAGQEAKFRSAQLSYYQGEFAWAKAQLDVLKSSTSQLIANDALNLSLLIAENTESKTDTDALKKYAMADRMIFSNQLNSALSVLDSIDLLYPGNSLSDDILMSKSKIFLKQNNITKAVESLQAITERYSYDIWGDDAVFMLAEIYETKLKDPEKAKIWYQKLITDFPGSLFVTEARKRFRNLRGDNLG